MKQHIQTMTILLMLAVILLAGCDGNKQEPQQPEAVEVPTEPKKEDTPIVEVNKQAEKPVIIDPTLPVSLEGLPTAFPDTFTPENKDVWSMIFEVCVKHPEYLESLIPSTAKEALELYDKSTSSYLYNKTSKMYYKLYAQAMFERFPDDLALLHAVNGRWTPNPHTSREEVLIFIEMGEHIHRVCDEQNIPSTSQWRAIRNLTNAYVYVDEYRKAAQNERELWAIVEHAKETGEYHEGLLRCFSTKPIFWLEEKAEEQEQSE